MKNRSIRFYLFLALCLVQLYVPAKMIATWHEVADSGREYRFRLRPVDPNDPFRGKFLDLSYQAASFVSEDSLDFKQGEQLFLTIKEDPQGFAVIDSISRLEPRPTVDYFTASLSHIVFYKENSRLFFDFPFNKYFLNETSAPLAEKLMAKALASNASQVWGLISIDQGRAVLKDLYINGTPFREILQAAKEEQAWNQ